MGKKTSEKRGKLFGVLNILDLIILLFLLSLGAALAFRGNVKDQLGSTADDVTVEFSVRIEPVRVMTYMAVEEGDPLFDNETGTRHRHRDPRVRNPLYEGGHAGRRLHCDKPRPRVLHPDCRCAGPGQNQ